MIFFAFCRLGAGHLLAAAPRTSTLSELWSECGRYPKPAATADL